MPFDTLPRKGSDTVMLHTPGLYVFTCKIHPYMFGAVIVDNPATTGLDLGETITLVNGITVPTSSDLATRLLWCAASHQYRTRGSTRPLDEP